MTDDRKTATNVRAHFPGIIILHTDAQLVDAYEIVRIEEGFNPNFGDGESKRRYLEVLTTMYADDPDDLGEHQEVLDAIEQCNSGEEG